MVRGQDCDAYRPPLRGLAARKSCEARQRAAGWLAEQRPPSPCGLRRGSLARFASEGWWGRKDSNLRSHEAADLQSAPFATRDTPPFPGHCIAPAKAGDTNAVE